MVCFFVLLCTLCAVQLHVGIIRLLAIITMLTI